MGTCCMAQGAQLSLLLYDVLEGLDGEGGVGGKLKREGIYVYI